MPQAILLAPQTRVLVSQQTEMPLQDVEAMLEVAQAARKNHGPCYVIIDYPTPEGGTVPWASMHKEYFEKHFAFEGTEYDKKFVPVKTLAPTTH